MFCSVLCRGVICVGIQILVFSNVLQCMGIYAPMVEITPKGWYFWEGQIFVSKCPHSESIFKMVVFLERSNIWG